MQQENLFQSSDPALIPVSECWFLRPDARCTADSQHLEFHCDGLKSSVWLISAIDRSVIFLDGEHDRRPDGNVIEMASHTLIEMTNAGLLFSMPLSKVIYWNAWQKGADVGFNNGSIYSNPYEPGTDQHKAWVDGYTDNASI